MELTTNRLLNSTAQNTDEYEPTAKLLLLPVHCNRNALGRSLQATGVEFLRTKTTHSICLECKFSKLHYLCFFCHHHRIYRHGNRLHTANPQPATCHPIISNPSRTHSIQFFYQILQIRTQLADVINLLIYSTVLFHYAMIVMTIYLTQTDVCSSFRMKI